MGQIVRIAALYELAANPNASVVSSENIKAALALAEYLEEHALKALTPATDEQPVFKVLAYLVSKAESVQSDINSSVGSVGAFTEYHFTTRTVQQQFSKSTWLTDSPHAAATLRGLFVDLSKAYWVQRVPTESTEKGGRPAELWALNPSAVERFRQLYA